MDEISTLVRKLTVDKSITNFIITADHRFLYKRDKLDESLINKRYILTRGFTPEGRQFHEKFTFKNRKYSKNETCYLVMMEVERHAFILDIAFASAGFI